MKNKKPFNISKIVVLNKEPIKMKLKDSKWTVCRVCMARNGLKGKDLSDGKCRFAFKTQKGFINHLKREHNTTVKNWNYKRGRLNGNKNKKTDRKGVKR